MFYFDIFKTPSKNVLLYKEKPEIIRRVANS